MLYVFLLTIFLFWPLRFYLSLPVQMYDILVVNKNYDAEGPDSISVRVGDLVEVLDMGVSSAAATAAGAKWVPANP